MPSDFFAIMFPNVAAVSGAPGRAQVPGEKSHEAVLVRRFWAALGSLLFFVIAPGTLAGYLPWAITGWRLKPAFLGLDALRAAGAALIFLGLIAVVESFARFVWKGFGTPAPVAPPTRLVVTGLYRWVRNPIYAGLIAIVIGEAFVLGDEGMLVYAAILWLFFHVWVLAIEEPRLGSSFGDEFATFKANVPRWLPRLTPWAGPAKDQAN